MKNKFLIFGFCLFGAVSQAQITGGFESNSQWYVDDKKVKIGEVDAEDRFRSNNYLKLDYNFKKWEFGTQFEAYVPKAIMNYSPDLDKFNVGTIFARYNDVDNGIDVTAGHFYDQLGSGLLFRSWEDRQLGINNAVFGLNAKYNLSTWGRLTAFGGKQRIGMGFDFAKSFLVGGDVEVYVSDLVNLGDSDLTVGMSYLGRKLDNEVAEAGLNDYNSGYAFRADYSKNNFNFEVEYVLKDEDYAVQNGSVKKKNLQKGNALYVNTGYSEKGFAVNLNLRRVENIATYSERELYANDYHKGIMNYVPALTKQYDYSLQNIYVYQAQSNLDIFASKSGEIGGQLDFYYNFDKGTSLGGEFGTNVVVNGSYWAGLKNSMDFVDNKLESEFLGFGRKYYRDFGVEVRKKVKTDLSFIFMYLNQYYDAVALLGKFEDVRVNIGSAEGTYQFAGSKSVRLELQHLWADTDQKNWAAGTVEFAANANWSFFMSDMYNYGNDDPEKKLHYYNGGVSYTKGVTRIAANYGRQRGGLLCVGGVCRMVSEAAGLTVGISTSF